MVFSSTTFLFLFFPLFLICYFIPKKTKIRNIVLLVFSLLFYAWGEPIYIFLILFSIIVNYYLTIIMDRKNSKLMLWLIVIFDLGMLFVFKYSNFLIDIVNGLANLNINHVNIVLPIGISFYTFQMLSYVIDVYRKDVKVQKKLSYLACYIVAFPQLIAGPIVRYITIEKELNNRKTTWEGFAKGIRRFIIGISKKVLIANNVAFIADQIFNQSATTFGFIGAFVGMIAYTLQIYFDFSGYSDMAIGMGYMLGFTYDENFNKPYLANSVTDFWRRWHISLSTFFRDYVYIPLGGNRVSVIKHIRNILIVWTLTGLWHGASFNFILWGLYYALFLLIEKYLLKNLLDKTPNILRHIITLIIINIGWVIFRFTDMNEMFNVFQALVGKFGLGNLKDLYFTGILSIRFILAFVVGIIVSLVPFKFEESNKFLDIILMILFILSIIFILVGSYNPFIYYRF